MPEIQIFVLLVTALNLSIAFSGYCEYFCCFAILHVSPSETITSENLPIKTGSSKEKAAKTSNEEIMKYMLICQYPNPPMLLMISSKQMLSMSQPERKIDVMSYYSAVGTRVSACR